MTGLFAHVSEFSDFCGESERLSFLSQFVFVYQRGMNTGGDVALDDITIFPGWCYQEPISPPGHNYGNLKPSLATSSERLLYNIFPDRFFLLFKLENKKELCSAAYNTLMYGRGLGLP